MSGEMDPVDRALQSLGGRSWPGSAHCNELESRLMQEFDTRRSVSPLGRHRVLVAALAVLVVGSVGFAAAGGVDWVRGWFHMTVQVNGEVVADEDVMLDENGQATLVFPAEALGDGKDLTITMDSGEIEAEDIDGEATATINADLFVDGEDAQLQVDVDVQEAEE